MYHCSGTDYNKKTNNLETNLIILSQEIQQEGEIDYFEIYSSSISQISIKVNLQNNIILVFFLIYFLLYKKLVSFDQCDNETILCKDYFTSLSNLNTLEFYPNFIMESNVLNLRNGYNMFSKTDLNLSSNLVGKGYVPVIKIISSTFSANFIRLDNLVNYPEIYSEFNSSTGLLKGLNFIKYNSTHNFNFNCKFSFVGQIPFYSFSNNVITSPGTFNFTVRIYLQIPSGNAGSPGIWLYTFTKLINSILPQTNVLTKRSFLSN